MTRLVLRLLAGAVLMSAGCLPARAQVPKVVETGVAAPHSAIFIGNSFFYYNNSMYGHVGRLSTSLGDKPSLRSTSVTISGSGLDWHDMESLLRPDG